MAIRAAEVIGELELATHAVSEGQGGGDYGVEWEDDDYDAGGRDIEGSGSGDAGGREYWGSSGLSLVAERASLTGTIEREAGPSAAHTQDDNFS